jgi:hypothetical protein
VFILKNSIGKSLPEKCIALLRNYYCSGQKKGPIGMEYNFFLNFHIFHSILMLMLFFFGKMIRFSACSYELLLSQYIKLAFFLKEKGALIWNLKMDTTYILLYAFFPLLNWLTFNTSSSIPTDYLHLLWFSRYTWLL